MKSKIVLLFFALNLIVGYEVAAQECNQYEVIKIDSTDNYFLITLEKEKETFLVISSKKRIKSRKAIKVKESYYFKLAEHKWQSEIPRNLIDIPKSIAIGDKVIWSSEGNYSLYQTKNLKGLNYIKKCDCPSR